MGIRETGKKRGDGGGEVVLGLTWQPCCVLAGGEAWAGGGERERYIHTSASPLSSDPPLCMHDSGIKHHSCYYSPTQLNILFYYILRRE